MDVNDQLFGNERTQETLSRLQQEDCIGLVKGMTEELARFTAGAEQSDDITMLALRYFGPSGS